MSAPVTVTPADAFLAEKFWRVHPAEITATGMTREQWYAHHIAAHRQQAASASNAQIAELVEALENITNFTDMSSRYVDADPLIAAARTALARAKSASDGEEYPESPAIIDAVGSIFRGDR